MHEVTKRPLTTLRLAMGLSLAVGLTVVPLTAFAASTSAATTTSSTTPGTVASAPKVHSLVASPTTADAPDGLFPFTTVAGKVYMSETAIGTNTPAGGPIYVQKDTASSTVQAAYLLAAAVPGYTIGNGTVTLDGTSLSFTSADDVVGNFGVNSVWTNVTTIVAPVVNAAPTGKVEFTAAEPTESSEITGEILAVIMKDPTLPTNNTVSLLFGALNTTGTSFSIGLSTPLKLSNPTLKLIMSIGDSFGYQGGSEPGTGQYSTITVNTKLMTSAAGGNDDSTCKYNTPTAFGTCLTGTLLTVGGIGDNTTDPSNPTATTANCATPPGPPRCTDELYTLLPFVKTGDTSIKVDTTNPSDDDNIFFAGFELNSAAAVVGEGAVLSPISGTSPVGSPYTFTAKVQNTTGVPIADQSVTFKVLSGPNAGKTLTTTTNATGKAKFTDTSTSTGTDTVQVSFVNGTGNTVTSNEATVTWTQTTMVPPASTTTTTSLSGGSQSGTSISVPVGTSVTDQASLSGTNASKATGTVTYSVYSNDTCTTVFKAGTAQMITTAGTLPASNPVTITTAGTYYWKASYSGDPANAKSTSACSPAAGGEVETVTKATPKMATSPQPATGTAGSTSLNDKVTLSGLVNPVETGTAAGKITVKLFSPSDSTCTGTATFTDIITASSGSGSYTTTGGPTASQAGTWHWTAEYSGDANNATVSSGCTAELVTVARATTKVTTSLSGGSSSGTSISVPIGTSVTDQATLSGALSSTATGKVTYDVYSTSTCKVAVSSGTPETITTAGKLPASSPVKITTAGTYYWKASYSGDTNNNTAASTCGTKGEVETVTSAVTTKPQPTKLRTSLIGSGIFAGGPCWWFGDLITVFAGAEVSDSATLSGPNAATAGGKVTYTVYSFKVTPWSPFFGVWTPVATAGTFTVTDGTVPNSNPVNLPVGIYEWQASYSGDSNNAPSKSRFGSETEVVIPVPNCKYGWHWGWSSGCKPCPNPSGHAH